MCTFGCARAWRGVCGLAHCDPSAPSQPAPDLVAIRILGPCICPLRRHRVAFRHTVCPRLFGALWPLQSDRNNYQTECWAQGPAKIRFLSSAKRLEGPPQRLSAAELSVLQAFL